MDHALTKELIEFFEEYVTPHKQELITDILSNRTRHVTIVLEDIFKSHNASAVVRTCECMGIQDMHVIENINDYVTNPYVTRGASKWMSMYKYPDPESCITQLKEMGYKIVVTSPHEKATSYRDFELDQPAALIFGTEFSGVSETFWDIADDFIYIPMVGFTESLNISVSAAIILQEFTSRLRNMDIDWQLKQEEMDELRLKWYKNVVKRSELLEERYLSEKD